jgi:hypothetical protein
MKMETFSGENIDFFQREREREREREDRFMQKILEIVFDLFCERERVVGSQLF